jgi:hypothetical protein
MITIDKLKAMLIEARKEKNTDRISLVSYLIGECTRNNKTPDAADVSKTLTKFVNTMKVNTDSKSLAEIQFVESLLPKLMSTDELESAVRAMNVNNIGTIMRQLKENFAGKYDGKLAKEIAERIIQEGVL